MLANGNVPVIVAMHPRNKEIYSKFETVQTWDHVQELSIRYRLRANNRIIRETPLPSSRTRVCKRRLILPETPCLTIRDETEWVETLEKGHNRLLSPDKCERLVDVVSEIQRSKAAQILAALW